MAYKSSLQNSISFKLKSSLTNSISHPRFSITLHYSHRNSNRNPWRNPNQWRQKPKQKSIKNRKPKPWRPKKKKNRGIKPMQWQWRLQEAVAIEPRRRWRGLMFLFGSLGVFLDVSLFVSFGFLNSWCFIGFVEWSEWGRFLSEGETECVANRKR